MPGYLNVAHRRWGIPEPPATPVTPEVYILVGDSSQVGSAGGVLTPIPPMTAPNDGNVFYQASFTEANALVGMAVYAIPLSDPEELAVVFVTSTDGGQTFAPGDPLGLDPLLETSAALSLGDLWTVTNDGVLYRSLDAAAWAVYHAGPWSDVRPTPDHVYVRGPLDPLDSEAPTTIVLLHGGGPVTLTTDGWFVGQNVESAVLIVGRDDATTLTLKRASGLSVTTVSGPPTVDQTVWPFARSYVDAKFNGTAMILVELAPDSDGVTWGGSFVARLWRSTNGGASFAMVKEYVTTFGGEGNPGSPRLAYSGTSPGIWWASAADIEGVAGFYRSEDDGLTWALIPSVVGALAASMLSAGRPVGRTG